MFSCGAGAAGPWATGIGWGPDSCRIAERSWKGMGEGVTETKGLYLASVPWCDNGHVASWMTMDEELGHYDLKLLPGIKNDQLKRQQRKCVWHTRLSLPTKQGLKLVQTCNDKDITFLEKKISLYDDYVATPEMKRRSTFGKDVMSITVIQGVTQQIQINSDWTGT